MAEEWEIVGLRNEVRQINAKMSKVEGGLSNLRARNEELLQVVAALGNALGKVAGYVQSANEPNAQPVDEAERSANT